MRRYALVTSLLSSGFLCIGLYSGCDDDLTAGGAMPWPEAGTRTDGAGIALDGRTTDLGALPDGLPQNAEGPTIEILTPKDKQTVVGDLIKIQAKVTDADGVDHRTVGLTVQGTVDPLPMTITTTPDVYEVLLDVANQLDKIRVWVVASDLQGNANSVIREFSRDPGPLIRVLAPADQSRHRSSVSIQIVVADPVPVTSFEARIGTTVLTLKPTPLGANQTNYSGSIEFDDFKPPLSGEQVITVTAINQNTAKSVLERVFFVDDAGPKITITSQAPGDLIGGIIKLGATITDEAGVVPSSVKAVIGHKLDTRSVTLKPSADSPNDYTGQFDTRTLTQTDLFPVMSFRATDQLGNESSSNIQAELDNGPPIISLDPPTSFRYWREKDKAFQCSHEFDPVGADNANDGDRVPQIMTLRARIEDQGNPVPSATWIPLAHVDQSSPALYVLDDASKALVIDSDGDGFCDAINPEVIPIGSTPAPGDAVAVNLAAVPPTGNADFTPHNDSCNPGDDDDRPKPLCLTTSALVAIYYTVGKLPGLYTIPPINPGAKSLTCLGLPFDFKVNQFTDKSWNCVAVEAVDNLGNRGVSAPIRLWYDQSLVQRTSTATPEMGPMPDCTGTLNPTTGKVDASKPCIFRAHDETFPQRFAPNVMREQP